MGAPGPRDPAPITRRVFAHMLVLDVAMYAALFWRPYDDAGQMLVAHYIGFVAVSDIGALFLPAAKRQWFNVFRFSSGLSFLVLTVALAIQGLDGEVLALTILRCSLAGARMVHAAWLIRVCGPWLDHVRAFPALAWTSLRAGDTSLRLSGGLVLIAASAVYFPSVVFWLHDNDGVSGLDATLTGMGPQNGLNTYLKLFVFEVLIVLAAPRFAMRAAVAGLFAVQVPMMLDMFGDAPIPYAHLAVEAFLMVLALAAFRAWRAAPAGTRGVGARPGRRGP